LLGAKSFHATERHLDEAMGARNKSESRQLLTRIGREHNLTQYH
jgi:hypothetical protein